jgi:hypothetical protein
MTYPMWSYFPRNVRPPAWANSFVEVVKSAESKISTVEHKTGLYSDAVLSNLSPGLMALGYVVESGKAKQTATPLHARFLLVISTCPPPTGSIPARSPGPCALSNTTSQSRRDPSAATTDAATSPAGLSAPSPMNSAPH